MLAVPSILAHNLLATHLDVSFQIRGHYCLTSHLLSASPQTAALTHSLSAPLVFNDIFFLSRKIEGRNSSQPAFGKVCLFSVCLNLDGGFPCAQKHISCIPANPKNPCCYDNPAIPKPGHLTLTSNDVKVFDIIHQHQKKKKTTSVSEFLWVSPY